MVGDSAAAIRNGVDVGVRRQQDPVVAHRELRRRALVDERDAEPLAGLGVDLDDRELHRVVGGDLDFAAGARDRSGGRCGRSGSLALGGRLLWSAAGGDSRTEEQCGEECM